MYKIEGTLTKEELSKDVTFKGNHQIKSNQIKFIKSRGNFPINRRKSKIKGTFKGSQRQYFLLCHTSDWKEWVVQPLSKEPNDSTGGKCT